MSLRGTSGRFEIIKLFRVANMHEMMVYQNEYKWHLVITKLNDSKRGVTVVTVR